MRADFTKRKFLSFPHSQQHKQCAELLREIYKSVLHGATDERLLSQYHDLLEWMKRPPLSTLSLQNISDYYHTHLREAGLSHKEHNLLPHVRQGDRTAGAPAWDIAIYLDKIRSAHNVGSILRTVEAFALGKVHFSESTPFATHKQVQDAAMGADKWVECFQAKTLNDLPRPLIAMETAATATPLFDYTFPESFTLIVGNEEYGCSEETLASTDAIIEIPLRGRKNSLNVANAFAIAAAEIYRQKGLSHGK